MSSNNSAKFAFYYILSLVALIFMALSTGMVIFQIINKYIIDIVNQYSGEYSDDAMKFAISAIFIATPIYFFLTFQIIKSLFNGELEKDSAIRKWLSYLILLVSSFIMIGWLINTLNGFLNGELSLKFLLKAVTSLAIAGSIFGFYFYDIKRAEVKGEKNKVIKIYFLVSLAVISVVFASALFIVESPTQTRDRKMDEQVVNSLSNVHSYLNRYYIEKGVLPDDFQVLMKEYSLSDKDFVNQITNEKFEYKLVDNTHYEICSVFRASNEKSENTKDYYFSKAIWNHGEGRYCFVQKIFESARTEPMPISD